ncbi:MAG: LacI family DNA-binding transcriptional regulator [Proteobacteria bacterium]|uniref:LacI family DNA-binding transcriptional regulator n=1 Tax=Candidatus Avisuccinivibrio stercorigallinarum TaxID=2840704 RepID=A0A9D9D9R8_9GAMM|nr:LacI family DNA-binding transcriptional regulator [Candidatus Avisuccinivibrio stercorigallinarum]
MQARVTMLDIAKRLGITKMTVSRFINDPGSVAKKTGERIKAAIDELGFVPSRVPTILSNKNSRTIGVLIPSFSNMVFAELIHGLELEAAAKGYTMLIMHTGYDENAEEQQIRELLSYQVDGLVLSEPLHSELTVRRLQAMSVPCVETMSIPEHPIDLCVGLDHRDIMYSCTKALLQSGRRLPLYIGVRLDIRTMHRQEGYEKAMREFGLTPFVLDSDERSNFTMAGRLLREGLTQHPELDAVLATNDDVAVGAMLSCQAAGCKIPDDIAFLGYNGLNIAAATIPPLCSVRTPREEMGRRAMRLLISKINEEEIAPEQRLQRMNFDITEGKTVTAAEFAALKACAAEACQQN